MNMLSGLKLELEPVLNLVCDMVSEIVPYARALAFFEDEKPQQLRFRMARHLDIPTPETLSRANLLNMWTRKYEGPLLIPHGSHAEADSLLDDVGAKSVLVVPLFVEARVRGSLQLFGKEFASFTEEDAQLLWMFSLLAEKLFPREYAAETFIKLAFTDFLTGLKTRRYLDEQLDREIKRAERRGSPLALIAIDIDHFKLVNDTYGHQAGDTILREVSARLLKGVREIDTVARYGGEEFTVILPDTNFAEADQIAERLRSDIEAASYILGSPWEGVRLTISLGVAAFPRDAKIKDNLLEAADVALYEAKRSGRNRVILYAELDIKPGMRLDQRSRIALSVRVWGMDINGQLFEQEAKTVDITTTGARLEGITRPLQRGCVIGIQHKTSKARYRVTWVGAEGTPAQSQIGLQLIDSGKLIWGRVIPRVFGDDSWRGRARPSSPGRQHSEVLSISSKVSGSPEPAGMSEPVQPKRSPRYRCSGSVSLQLHGVQYPICAAVLDISLTGCYVELSTALPVGTKALLLLNIEGVTIHTQAELRVSHPGVGMGFAFRDMSDADRTSLQELIARLAKS
jgi:diguanylate cyclase (GGDEF)-like protein